MSMVRDLTSDLVTDMVNNVSGSDGGFSPLDISGALIGITSYESNLSKSGNNVSQADDLTSNGNDLLSNTEANQPQHGSTTQNGKGTFYFTNDYFSLDGTTTGGALSGFDSDEYTMFVTFKEYSARTTNTAVVCTRLTTAADLFTGKLGTTNRTYLFGLNTGDYTNTSEGTILAPEDQWNVVVARANSTGVYLDVGGTETQMESTQPDAGMWNTLQLGRRAANSSLNEMELAHFWVWPTSLPQADVDALIGYGMNELGL